jgi:hypothetical protein
MTEPNHRIYNSFVGFRAPDDFLIRFEHFSRMIGRRKSDVARYLLAQCMTSYESDTDAIAKIRQAII